MALGEYLNEQGALLKALIKRQSRPGKKTLGRQLVVKPANRGVGAADEKRRKSIRQRRFQMVEMRRLELLTPYMRSKCSTS
jgi:hypothetical protein